MGWQDEARQRYTEKQQGSTIKLLEGNNCLRILPNKKDLQVDGTLNPKGIQHKPFIEFLIHRDVGPDKVFLGCGHDITGGGSCWLCDVKIPELEASGDSGKIKRAQALQAKEQFIVIASRFDPNERRFSLPKPWWVSTGSGIPGRQSTSLATRVLNKLTNNRKDYLDPIKGHNLNVERTGQMLKTKYPEVEGDEHPTKLPVAILLKVDSLTDVVPQYDEADMRACYFGKPRPERGEHRVATEEETTEEGAVAEGTTEGEYEAEAGVEGEVEPGVEGEVEYEAEAEVEAEPELEAEAGVETEYEPEPEPEPEPAPRRPAARPVPAPARPAARPAVPTQRTAPTLARRPAPAPARRLTPKPPAKPAGRR